MLSKIKREIREMKILLRSVPAPIVTLFAVSVIMMNLLANKSINLPVNWLALDCGIVISWVSFMSMDIITKHFGPKAANEISVFAVIINLAVCAFLFIAGKIPGMWGESFIDSSGEIINNALDNTFSGTWYVLFGSTVAFVASAFINNFSNYFIGKFTKKNPQGFLAYALRTYVSTAIGQFFDNIIFALIVSHFFFGWTLTQCVTCAATGMIVELICEILFSPIGYSLCKKWEKEHVGQMYFELKNDKNGET